MKDNGVNAGRKMLEEMRASGIPPQTKTPANDDEYQEDGMGRWKPHQQFGVRIIWPGKGKAKRSETIQYGSIVSRVHFEQDDHEKGSIWFEFMEERAGLHLCTIKGVKLDCLCDHLSEGRRVTLRVMDDIASIEIVCIQAKDDE